MLVSKDRLAELIVRELHKREMRLLTLVVAVRKQLNPHEAIKGNLADIIRTTLRPLMAAKKVVEVEGTYMVPKIRAMQEVC